jgi:hypothetical protein
MEDNEYINELIRAMNKMSRDAVEDNFEEYRKITSPKDDRIIILPDGREVIGCVNTQISFGNPLVKKDGTNFIIDKSIIDKLSPDNIDINEFWEKATTDFPMTSVFGSNHELPNMTEASGGAIRAQKVLGVLDELDKVLVDEDARILEIGPGFGSTMFYINTNYSLDNYWAIDVNPLIGGFERIHKCDGQSIPSVIPHELDVVYSMNCFQHLTDYQRSGYYNDVYARLVDGGTFLFGMFVVTEENQDLPIWQNRDEDDNRYCSMFNQFTRCPWKHEIIEELEGIGFEIAEIPLANGATRPSHVHYHYFKAIKR